MECNYGYYPQKTSNSVVKSPVTQSKISEGVSFKKLALLAFLFFTQNVEAGPKWKCPIPQGTYNWTCGHLSAYSGNLIGTPVYSTNPLTSFQRACTYHPVCISKCPDDFVSTKVTLTIEEVTENEYANCNGFFTELGRTQEKCPPDNCPIEKLETNFQLPEIVEYVLG